jgi:hypothetical protein
MPSGSGWTSRRTSTCCGSQGESREGDAEAWGAAGAPTAGALLARERANVSAMSCLGMTISGRPRDGIKAPLPEDWKPCKSSSGDIYYFNFRTGDSRWEHPQDDFYKELYRTEREKSLSAPVAPIQKQQKPTKLMAAPPAAPKSHLTSSPPMHFPATTGSKTNADSAQEEAQLESILSKKRAELRQREQAAVKSLEESAAKILDERLELKKRELEAQQQRKLLELEQEIAKKARAREEAVRSADAAAAGAGGPPAGTALDHGELERMARKVLACLLRACVRLSRT